MGGPGHGFALDGYFSGFALRPGVSLLWGRDWSVCGVSLLWGDTLCCFSESGLKTSVVLMAAVGGSLVDSLVQRGFPLADLEPSREGVH